MAHYAQINNNIVQQVLVLNNDWTDKDCQDWLAANVSTDQWVRTSYNTNANTHSQGKTPFRKNYAGIGYTYDNNLDAFIPPKPFASWTLNEDTGLWDAPVEYPDDGETYSWDEESASWVEM